MERQIGKVIAAFREMGLKPKLDNFDSRLVMQKAICLLEMMGVDFGYSFSLYVRGAYSPQLTEQLYDHQSELEALKASARLSKEELSKIAELKAVMTDASPAVFEIAATYAFLVNAYGMAPISAMRQVKEMKPFYSETDFALGFSKAKELISTVSSEELQKLKKEMEPWNRAADEDGEKWL
ncbi:hypothetical protein DRN67_00170 [Candidatus Micrarchaeota archaeon]|nr:MAG: hypothetical protein DRN67_00170 [Candidatus Micrarchaeota archaeon]